MEGLEASLFERAGSEPPSKGVWLLKNGQAGIYIKAPLTLAISFFARLALCAIDSKKINQAIKSKLSRETVLVTLSTRLPPGWCLNVYYAIHTARIFVKALIDE